MEETEDVLRSKNYNNCIILPQDEDNFNYDGMNQLDAKVFFQFI